MRTLTFKAPHDDVTAHTPADRGRVVADVGRALGELLAADFLQRESAAAPSVTGRNRIGDPLDSFAGRRTRSARRRSLNLLKKKIEIEKDERGRKR